MFETETVDNGHFEQLLHTLAIKWRRIGGKEKTSFKKSYENWKKKNKK